MMRRLILIGLIMAGPLARAEDPSFGLSHVAEPRPLPCADLLGPRPNHKRLEALAKTAEQKIKTLTRAASEQPKATRPYFELTARAAAAAVTKHQKEFMEEPDLRKLDFQRHLAILEAIAAFDDKRPQWSLFNIKRVIETRHSLKNYADCVDDDDDAHPSAH